jgi:hypothetical protein
MHQCLMNVYHSQCTVVFPPTGGIPVTPNPSNILDYALKTNCYNLMIVPSFFKAWYTQEESVLKLTKFPLVVSLLFWKKRHVRVLIIFLKSYGAGPLAAGIGDSLAKAGVRIRSLYGTTETGVVIDVFPKQASPDEWCWFSIWDQLDVRWEAQGDGTYEAVFLVSSFRSYSLSNSPY